MSEDQDETPPQPIYSSAGMAAAGMGPRSRRTREPSPAPEEVSEEELSEEKLSEEAAVIPPGKSQSDGALEQETNLSSEDPSGEYADELEKPDLVEDDSYITEIYVGDNSPTTEANPPPVASEATATSPTASRKVAILGRESEGALREIFDHLGGLDAITPGESDDFREFVERESPEMVVVATPGNSDHHELASAALESGAHVFCAPPFTRTLKEADSLVALAESKALTLSVGNALICHPAIRGACQHRESLIGDLLEMRIYGEMDARAGGEDLLVNGTMLFDIARIFGGTADWCCSVITQRGERAMGEHIFHSREANLGQLLGDRIYAQFGMDSGVLAHFVSDQKARQISGPQGIELIGSRSKMRLHVSNESPPAVSVLQNPDPSHVDRMDQWAEWTGDGSVAESSPLEDWISAIETSGESKGSGSNALKSLEMAHAVWQAGLSGKRVYFPLVNRLHPLNEELL